jgi:hypothetical protein
MSSPEHVYRRELDDQSQSSLAKLIRLVQPLPISNSQFNLCLAPETS